MARGDQALDNALARTGNQVKAQHFFFANDQAIGSFGQLTDEDGAFEANFDINYTPISSSYPAVVPSQVVVQGGDTLRTIAARVYGDASLWYVIAEENGLSDPDSVLQAGTQLRVPSEVVSLANTAWSFKPFDVSRAIGDTTPTQPPINRQKKNFWKKVIGIILVAVAVVVSVIVQDYTGSLINGALGVLSNLAAAAVGGAAGSIVQQGLAIATGLQDSFSWDAVASAG